MSYFPRKPSFLLLLCVLVASQYPNTNGSNSQNHTTFIFHHCSTEKLDDLNGEYENARSTLLRRLVVQSSTSKSSRSFAIVESQSSADTLSGVFQCRGDLDDRKCNECMKAAQHVSSGLCGNSMAGRIQLSGCQVKYEADEYESSSTTEGLINHSNCGEPLLLGTLESAQFEQLRSKSFKAMEDELAANEKVLGFYTIKQEGAHAFAQCEVGIALCDCAKCVIDAIHVLEDQCHEPSIYAQIFMDLCYFSFEFSPHEITHANGGGIHHPPEKKGFGGKGKLVALAVGGAFLIAMAFTCFRFFKKKDDDLWYV